MVGSFRVTSSSQIIMPVLLMMSQTQAGSAYGHVFVTFILTSILEGGGGGRRRKKREKKKKKEEKKTERKENGVELDPKTAVSHSL